MPLTAPELVLLLVQIGSAWGAIRWWLERRDARSTLATAKATADKTVTTLTETVGTLKAEIDELKEDHVEDRRRREEDRRQWHAERQQLTERIAHLERLHFGGGT